MKTRRDFMLSVLPLLMLPLTMLGKATAAFMCPGERIIPTGFPALDKLLGGGIRIGKLVIICGAPGSGKSTLKREIRRECAAGGYHDYFGTGKAGSVIRAAESAVEVNGLSFTEIGIPDGQSTPAWLLAEARKAGALLIRTEPRVYPGNLNLFYVVQNPWGPTTGSRCMSLKGTKFRVENFDGGNGNVGTRFFHEGGAEAL